MLAADEDLNREGGHVEPRRVLDVDRYLLVGQLLENARAAARTHHNRGAHTRWNHRSQDAACAHERVSERHERQDGDVDTLESGRWALEVSVVDRKHHGASGLRPEDTRKPVAHPPVERP